MSFPYLTSPTLVLLLQFTTATMTKIAVLAKEQSNTWQGLPGCKQFCSIDETKLMTA